MKEKISLYKKRVIDAYQQLSKRQKIILPTLAILAIGSIATLVFASPEGHDTPVIEVQQTEQIVVRKVGDVDADAISQEGLSSFYGEIISKDIASINASREGVISSWNVSVGDKVSAGAVLGYVTVTGVSPEQQMQLAEQQANALKASLDLETSKIIANETESVFQRLSNSLKSVADKQLSVYNGITSGSNTTYQTELKAITANKLSLENKLQDFANTALTAVYPIVSAYGNTPFNGSYYEASLKWEFAVTNSELRSKYVNLFKDLAIKIRSRSVTDQDIRTFLDKTIEGVNYSLETENFTKSTVTDEVKDLQAELREISNALAEATIATASKEREKDQIEIELTKNLSELNNELDLKKLEQTSANARATGDAKVAQLLAEKLAVSAGGVIPILAAKSGVVATVEKNVGDYVTISDRVGFISNANPRKNVRFTIPASWKDINQGDTLSISWRPEYSMGSAVITGISPIIDEKGGYQAEAAISKDTPFPVGASVRIIPENSKKGVFVNRKAVVFEGVQPYVWIVTESNTLRKQEVKIGRGLGEYVEILAGLEREFSYLVILDPLVQIKSGMMLSEILKTETKVEVPASSIQDESQPHEH